MMWIHCAAFGRARIDPAERTDRARYRGGAGAAAAGAGGGDGGDGEEGGGRKGGDVLHDLSISSLANGQINQPPLLCVCVCVCVCVFLFLMHSDALQQLSVGEEREKKKAIDEFCF